MSKDDPATVPRTIAFGRKQFEELKRTAASEDKSFSEAVRDLIDDGYHFRVTQNQGNANPAYRILGGEQ